MSQSMKQNRWTTTAPVVAGLLFLVGIVTPVVADDVFPPSWRGQPFAITAAWDEWTNFPVGMPADNSFPPGWPAQASVNPFAGMARVNVFGRTNVLTNTITTPGPQWDLSFFLANVPVPNAEKLIRVQITYNANYAAPDGFTVDPDIGPTVTSYPTPSASTPRDANGWVTSAYDLSITPNPSAELIYFGFSFLPFPPLNIRNAYVDQVVIDTICIPEPAGASLILLASACLFDRGRRARERGVGSLGWRL